MKELTKKEILEELERLGITKPSDIRNFLREYESYIQSEGVLLEQLKRIESHGVD